MTAKTTIEWTNKTWVPITGCTRVSSGCDFCYAAKMTEKFGNQGFANYKGLYGNGHFNGKVRIIEDRIHEPLKWVKPQKVFLTSMSDLFHKEVPDETLYRIFAVMSLCQDFTFQILTKRHVRMNQFLNGCPTHEIEQHREAIFNSNIKVAKKRTKKLAFFGAQDWDWPLPNVWVGVSVENSERADERIPALLESKASVRFISAEPLLGGMLIESYLRKKPKIYDMGYHSWDRGLDWVIAGSESGQGARPMNEDWIRSLRDQCVENDVRFFYKQKLDPNGSKISTPALDGKRWTQFPKGKIIQ